MGRPTTTVGKALPAQQYRDEPDTDAVSMHTTRSDYDYDDAPDLPSYSDSEAAASAGDANIPASEDAPRDEYAVVQPPASTGWRINSQGKSVNPKETTIRMDERLNDPEALYEYITKYLQVVAPKPAVRIRGWHYQTVRRDNKKETERVVDFDIMLYLSAYLPVAAPEPVIEEGGWRPRIAVNSDHVYRGGWRKTRAQGYGRDIEVGTEPRPDLMHWCQDYCNSKTKLKIFRVKREVPGLDQQYLRDQLEPLVRSTNYRGHVDLSYPIEEKHVDIYSPHIINKWRINWVRYIFYFTFLWLITWPILFFTTKWWDVYTVNWCFSWQQSDGRGGLVKRYAGITEQAWLAKHANMIRALVLDGYQGDATHLPLDVQSRSRREGDGRMPQTGNTNVDAAVDFIQGGVTVWNAVSRGAGRDANGWGADS